MTEPRFPSRISLLGRDVHFVCSKVEDGTVTYHERISECHAAKIVDLGHVQVDDKHDEDFIPEHSEDEPWLAILMIFSIGGVGIKFNARYSSECTQENNYGLNSWHTAEECWHNLPGAEDYQ